MLKKDIRKKYLDLRKTLSKDEVSILSKKIFENFILQFKPVENQKVHLFLSISKFNEIDTFFFLNYFFEKNICVFVPKIVEDKLISVKLFADSELETNSWGIPEPKSNMDSGEKDFDFVITPLLYCDNQGNRVGYGKGFYDQFFAEINATSKKIGINYFPPSETIDDVFENDIPLDYLITAESCFNFG